LAAKPSASTRASKIDVGQPRKLLATKSFRPSIVFLIRSLQVTRDTESEIVSRRAAVVAKRHPELGIRRAPPARSSDDAERPAFRPERIDRLLRGRLDGDLLVILHPLGHVAADVEEPERVGREASDGRRDVVSV